MKKLFSWGVQVLLAHFWALPALLLAGFLAGHLSASALAQYTERMQEAPDAMSAFVLALDIRNLMPVIGVFWAIVCLGLDFEGRGINHTLCRGFSRTKVFLVKFTLFLAGAALCSLVSQIAAVYTVLTKLPAKYVLRCFGLRLLLDLGMMAVPVIFVYTIRQTIPALCIGCLYGFALYITMGSHYALWLPEMYENITLADLWPLAGLILSPVICLLLWRKANLS